MTAIRAEPLDIAGAFAAAVDHHRAGRLAEARSLYEAILSAQPQHIDAGYNLGLVHLAAWVPDAALPAFDRVLALRPDHADAHNNRGIALADLGRIDDALTAYDRALALRPELPEAWNNRGNALSALGAFEAAVASYDSALALRPDHVDALVHRGHALTVLRRSAEARASYARAHALDPDRPLLLGNLVESRIRLCDWQGIGAQIDSLWSGIGEGRLVAEPFAVLALTDDPLQQKQAAATYAAARFPRDDSLGPVLRPPRGRRIRLGYYSADLHDHALGYLCAQMFEAHDRDRFETFAFSYGPDRNDAMRRRLRAAFDEFHDVRDRSDRDIAILSREIGIDIAIDLTGYTRGGRPGIFALGCAPVQVSFMGYPGTMAAEPFDYIIVDPVLAGDDDARHYSEALIRLPGSYQPNDSTRVIADGRFERSALGLPEDGFVFACFSAPSKLLPDTFGMWMTVLDAVPGSVLWLYADDMETIANLRCAAADHGIDGGRLVFAPPMPHALHLARHRAADLFLDSFPYTGHTTASDALWAGVPLVTRAGRSFASRVAASLLHAVGLPELVTESNSDCAVLAIALARDPARLADLRERLGQARETSSLFDGHAYARKIEAAYAAIYERDRAGLPPVVVDLPVPPTFAA